MMNNPVGWFEIYVQNVDKAKAFYEKLLATTLNPIAMPGDDGLVMLGFPANMDSYGASGAIVYMPNVGSAANSTLVYFSCEDCSIEESRTLDAGGIIERSKMSIGEHGFISLVQDPDGNLVGLHSMK